MNKLMARVVAVVMAVMMLGTVSFAATTLSGTNDVITPDIADVTSGIYTVKAYTDVTNTIVAMYQGAKPEPIEIDPEKIGETDNNVVVEFNGKGGTKTTVNLPITRKPADVEYVVDVMDKYEFDGKKYIGVAHVTNTFIPSAVVSRLGYILTASGEGVAGNPITFEYEDVAISGDGEVEFDVVVLNVTEGVEISAKAFIEY